MKILGFEIDGPLPKQKKQVADATASQSKGVSSRVKTVNLRVNRPGLDYDGTWAGNRTELFNPPEYDLGQIARAIDTDAYLRRALTKYVQNIWRNGYRLEGKNPDTVNYIKTRVAQIEDVTGVPWYQFLDDVAQQVVYYHNCFIAKVRNEKASGGSRWKDFTGKERIPVAGYFTQDATSIEIMKLQKGGKVLKYRQYMSNTAESEMPKWTADDMIHIHLDRKVGLSYGCPMVIPVLPDIMALRRIEENIEILVFQYSIPFFQYKVGFEGGEYDADEISQVKEDLKAMVTEGMVVTPPHHEIKAIGAEGRAIRAEGYLKYFKQRVFSGLGTSGLGMGEDTGGKATANHLTKEEIDVVERYARAICKSISFYIFRELLQEGGFDIRDERNIVQITVPPIDIEEQHAIENHALSLYQGNILDEDETRSDLDREPISEEQREKMNLQLVKMPQMLIQSIDEPYLSSGGKFPKSVKDPSVKKTANVNQPTNQYGQKPAKTTPVNDKQADAEPMNSILDQLGVKSLVDKLSTQYELTAEDTQECVYDLYIKNGVAAEDLPSHLKKFNEGRLKLTFEVTLQKMKDIYMDHMKRSYTLGILDGSSQLNVHHSDTSIDPADIRDIAKWAEENVNLIIGDVTKKVVGAVQVSDHTRLLSDIRGVFDANKYRLDFFGRSHLWRPFVLGQLHVAKSHMDPEDEVVSRPLGDPELSCRPPHAIKIGDLTPTTIPPYHANCTHALDLSGGKKGN